MTRDMLADPFWTPRRSHYAEMRLRAELAEAALQREAEAHAQTRAALQASTAQYERAAEDVRALRIALQDAQGIALNGPPDDAQARWVGSACHGEHTVTDPKAAVLGLSRPHRCPVCEGRGTMPQGFYSRFGVATSTAPVQCQTCKGKGVVWS